jgi:DNA-binding helix-hairpin-helix protein with protein kinase domain
MRAPDLYIGNKRLELVKRIGKGGEGEVWLLAGEAKQAVKFYTLADLASREAKVRAMVKLGLSDTYKLVSYPREAVTSKAGKFAGFTMNLVEGGRQLHELYGVKSRKIHFPNKDYRFLVRAAANTARAVAQVHSSPCVIGDLNHSGVLVRSDATVALIDADSFQLQSDGKIHPCLVGVPEFTPPELQGRPLGGVVRTKQHDEFGLAVAIFHLLCMGRHPYAGLFKGPDLTLDQLIARNIFAYSLTRSNGATPPAGAVTLDIFQPEIASAFDRAFGPDPAQRPTAADWINQLEMLEKRLSRCAVEGQHYFPSTAKTCPWCKLEAVSGAILFLPIFTGGAPRTFDLGNFDVERVWAAIRGITVPDAASLTPPLPALPNEPSAEARKLGRATMFAKSAGVGLGVAVVVCWIAVPALAIFWFMALIAALVIYNSKRTDTASWQKRYSDVDRRLEEALQQWRTRLGHTQLVQLRSQLVQAAEEYKGLPAAKAQAHAKQKAERQQRQLHDFLDNFLIQRASIPGIGPAKTITLRSFGIESAADVERYKVLIIPGFGSATADKLVSWRTSIERRFVYNPSPTPADASATAKVEADFMTRQRALSTKIAGGHKEMEQIAAALQQRLRIEDPRLVEIAKARAQLAADLSHLGIAKPSLQPAASPIRAVPPQTARPTSPTAKPAFHGVACPRCGSAMIRRIARKGRRRGNSFWGCSRYPICTGTRV